MLQEFPFDLFAYFTACAIQEHPGRQHLQILKMFQRFLNLQCRFIPSFDLCYSHQIPDFIHGNRRRSPINADEDGAGRYTLLFFERIDERLVNRHKSHGGKLQYFGNFFYVAAHLFFHFAGLRKIPCRQSQRHLMKIRCPCFFLKGCKHGVCGFRSIFPTVVGSGLARRRPRFRLTVLTYLPERSDDTVGEKQKGNKQLFFFAVFFKHLGQPGR